MPTACNQCATDLEDDASVCAHCGAPVPAPLEKPVQQATEPAPSLAPTFSTRSDLEGIGGWLILVAIGLALTPLRSVSGITTTLNVLYGSRYQLTLSAHPALAGLILFEAITNTVYLAALVTLNFLFYQKKKAFPTGMIVFLSAQVIITVFDHLAALHFGSDTSPTAVWGNFAAAAIWIPYYLLSKRVKATFVD
jgi:hypothetical protein